MAGSSKEDFQRRWRLGVPGRNKAHVVLDWIRRTVPQVFGDGASKAILKRSLSLPIHICFALSRQIGVKYNNPFEGLEWVPHEHATWELVPQWAVEPDLEAVRRAVEAVFPLQDVSATFLAQGGFNKVYNIRCGEREYIMRVSLPVDPKWKTLSEVATLKWMRREASLSLPVADVFAYKASRRDNPVGFEWILMSKLPGMPLAHVWRSMSLEAKKELVRKFAIYSSRLFEKQLRGIGNIYPVSKPKASISSVFKSKPHDKDNDLLHLPEVKRIVSMEFFWGGHIFQKTSRGPFRSSKDWLDARFSLIEHDYHSTLARCEGKVPGSDSEDEHNASAARKTLAIVRSLKDLSKSFFSEQDASAVGPLNHLRFSSCFPSSEQVLEDAYAEPSMLVHVDLSRRNILVDKAGALTGVVDWEFVSALPLWKACDYPTFLKEVSTPRYEWPDKTMYRRFESDDEDLGQEGSLYWEHVLEYELTILRPYFLDEMRRLAPGWIKVFEASQGQRDFDLATRLCNNSTSYERGKINAWLDGLNSGEENPRSLRSWLYEYRA